MEKLFYGYTQDDLSILSNDEERLDELCLTYFYTECYYSLDFQLLYEESKFINNGDPHYQLFIAICGDSILFFNRLSPDIFRWLQSLKYEFHTFGHLEDALEVLKRHGWKTESFYVVKGDGVEVIVCSIEDVLQTVRKNINVTVKLFHSVDDAMYFLGYDGGFSPHLE
ncbi:MAG: hypothetical protein ACI8XB_002616 [Patiriisocius sp.]|jgi:hypothetical protein